MHKIMRQINWFGKENTQLLFKKLCNCILQITQFFLIKKNNFLLLTYFLLNKFLIE